MAHVRCSLCLLLCVVSLFLVGSVCDGRTTSKQDSNAISMSYWCQSLKRNCCKNRVSQNSRSQGRGGRGSCVVRCMCVYMCVFTIRNPKVQNEVVVQCDAKWQYTKYNSVINRRTCVNVFFVGT